MQKLNSERVDTRKHGVYRIINIENGKLYIGSSGAKKFIKNRLYVHLWEARNNMHHSKSFQEDFDIFGEDVFYFEIIEECNLDKCFERENHWLQFYKSYENDKGYNIQKTAIEHQSRVISDETKEKLSKKSKAFWENNAEMKKLFSDRRIGKKATEATKKISSEAHKGYVFDEERRLRDKGKPKHDPEVQKARVQKAMAKRKANGGYENMGGRKVICNKTDQIFNTITECAEFLGCNPKKLIAILSGVQINRFGVEYVDKPSVKKGQIVYEFFNNEVVERTVQKVGKKFTYVDGYRGDITPFDFKTLLFKNEEYPERSRQLFLTKEDAENLLN